MVCRGSGASGWGQAHTCCCWCPQHCSIRLTDTDPRQDHRPAPAAALDPFQRRSVREKGRVFGCGGTHTRAQTRTHTRNQSTLAQHTRAQHTHTQRTQHARTHSRALTHTYTHARAHTFEGGRHQPPTHQGAWRSQSCATRARQRMHIEREEGIASDSTAAKNVWCI